MKNLLLTLAAIVFCFSFSNAQNSLDPCEGSTEKYSVPPVSGTGTYLWDVTNGGAVMSIVGNCVFVNWHTPGVDTLTVVTIDSLGMLDTINNLINVHPLPKPLITPSFTSTCDGDSSQHNGPGSQDAGRVCMSACDSMAITYCTPLNAGSTYSWTVVNGTIFAGAGTECVTVIWGDFPSGNIKVVENTIFGCVDSTEECITIYESPNAQFTHVPSACVNTPVSFFDGSYSDIINWSWDFGDGGTSTNQHPTHIYLTGGTYTVSLIVENECHCRDTVTSSIFIDVTPGPEIECPTTVCEGDCETYSTSAVCGTYMWTAIGGTITSGIGTNTITICWGSGPVGTLSLQVAGCSPALCPIPTIVYIPIISQNPTIIGTDPVCQYSIGTYCLPTFPGSIYTWTVPPSQGLILSGQFTQCIDVQWYGGPIGTVIVNVANELLDCEGNDTLQVDVLPEYSAFGPSEVCFGDTAFFNAFPGTMFTWATSTGSIVSGVGTGFVGIWFNGATGLQTVSVWPTTPGVYCNDTITVQVNVFGVPEPDSINGNKNICPGDTYLYTAMTSQAGVTFEWFVQNGTPASV